MSPEGPEKLSIESWMRKSFQPLLGKVAAAFLRAGLTPNQVTLIGLVGTMIAAVLAANGKLWWGGLVLLLMAPLDAVDGAMARLRGKASPFGAFLDSTMDRYEELILLGGLLYYFWSLNNPLGMGLTYLAACGSVLVSYTRARAEALGLTAKVGILSRVERAIVLVLGLLFGIPLVSVGIIALLANVTALQRIAAVARQSQSNK